MGLLKEGKLDEGCLLIHNNVCIQGKIIRRGDVFSPLHHLLTWSYRCATVAKLGLVPEKAD